MYCRKCGNNIDEDDIYCKNCGIKIFEDDEEEYNDTMGKTAQILVTISLFINPFGILSILGIVFGAISWIKATKYRENIRNGKNAVYCGIIITVVWILFTKFILKVSI